MDKPRRRKLLVATLGVAAVSYAVATGCKKDDEPISGNLPAPPPPSATTPPISGNLPAPPPVDAAADAADATADAGADGSKDAGSD